MKKGVPCSPQCVEQRSSVMPIEKKRCEGPGLPSSGTPLGCCRCQQPSACCGQSTEEQVAEVWPRTRTDTAGAREGASSIDPGSGSG